MDERPPGRRQPTDEADCDARIERLRGHVDDCIFGRRGILVIPAFSIGRAQEVLFDLHWLFATSGDRYDDVPVFFDAPMARKVGGVYLDALARTEQTRKGVKFQWLSKMLWRRLGLDCERGDDRVEDGWRRRHGRHVPDKVGDVCDVCSAVYDPDQRDSDSDGTGDACLDGDG